MHRQGHFAGASSAGPSTAGADDSSIFFAGAPASVTERDIRVLFERIGHVSGLRLIPSKTRPVTEGYVDFSDATDARAAVDRLNGHLFAAAAGASSAAAAEAASVIGGEYKLMVQLASVRKRQREGEMGGGVGGGHHHGGHGGSFGGGGRGGGRGGMMRGGGRGGRGGGFYRSEPHVPAVFVPAPDSDDEATVGGGPTAPPLCFPKHYTDPISQALAQNVSMRDAFDAVEQLRVLSLERPDETKELLDKHPALKVAVIQILQVAGTLPPMLPQEAFKAHGPTTNYRTHVRQTEAKARLAAMGGVPVAAAPTTAAASSSAASSAAPAAAVVSSASAPAPAVPVAAPQPAAAPAATAPQQFSSERLFEEVAKLSEAQLQKMKEMRPEAFDKLKEPTRSLFKQLNALLNSM